MDAIKRKFLTAIKSFKQNKITQQELSFLAEELYGEIDPGKRNEEFPQLLYFTSMLEIDLRSPFPERVSRTINDLQEFYETHQSPFNG